MALVLKGLGLGSWKEPSAVQLISLNNNSRCCKSWVAVKELNLRDHIGEPYSLLCMSVMETGSNFFNSNPESASRRLELLGVTGKKALQ